MTEWTADELAAIAGADDLHIAPLRPDGVTFGTPTWIWSVAVDGGLYVRAYHGVQSRWYQAALTHGAGRITAAGITARVHFEAVTGPVTDHIDAAYHAKYATSPYLPAMIATRTRAATIRIKPAQPQSDAGGPHRRPVAGETENSSGVVGLPGSQIRQASTEETPMDRIQRSEQTSARLFGPRDTSAPDLDPELWAILRRLIFGEVFHTGDLDERTRELITVTVLTTMQTLPQLQAHAGAALNVGVTPVQLREAVYQCAPFIGFPKTLNAVAVLNEVFTERGIALPLPHQGTTTEQDRFEAGRAIQIPIYGDEIAESVAGLPEPFRDAVPRFLTAFGFGDFYTRTGLDVPTRELLILCLLAALGQAAQIKAHIIGNLRLGNSKATQVAALVHCFPYIGFPLALNAIRVIQEVPDQPNT